MFPPELVELSIYHAWDCLSTSSHRHSHSMAQWMLVSRDWLKIVLSVVFRDLWITYTHIEYIIQICKSNKSFICEIAGIMDVRLHLAQTCRSLTVSVYTNGEYTTQCRELIEYATTESDSDHRKLLPGISCIRYKAQIFCIPTRMIATVIRDYVPLVTSLHFVVVDCTATYRGWNTFAPRQYVNALRYPLSLTELHVTFAYTSPPPVLLLDAPRGTFFPPPYDGELPMKCCFDGVRRLVVRDANADFVAFLTTACPRLETVESTAQFSAGDVPPDVPTDVKDRLVFVRLPRSATWGITGSDSLPLPDEPVDYPWPVPPPTQAVSPVRKRRINSLWHLLKRIFQERN
ncbi:hypothetical protein B0H19DRAFT_1121747 [Mycena capillaripes]|nr:hypothetical protein B0H19DRAFT_1121747 [Mycena capillaripes]